jgi:hypothetical protein
LSQAQLVPSRSIGFPRADQPSDASNNLTSYTPALPTITPFLGVCGFRLIFIIRHQEVLCKFQVTQRANCETYHKGWRSAPVLPWGQILSVHLPPFCVPLCLGNRRQARKRITQRLNLSPNATAAVCIIINVPPNAHNHEKRVTTDPWSVRSLISRRHLDGVGMAHRLPCRNARVQSIPIVSPDTNLNAQTRSPTKDDVSWLIVAQKNRPECPFGRPGQAGG